jgi:hypothetical protein
MARSQCTKSSKRLARETTSTAYTDDLRRFRDAKATTDELDRKIAFTNELIDQIVYRLYGLTDEEIETIEAETT